MPLEGQQHVYGAQHPPSIKLIKELKSSGTSSSSSGGGGHKSFKDYEKKTCDVWDVDDDLVDYNQLLDSPNLISITDSEEMARRVIKNHQDNQERHKPQQTESPSKAAANANTSPSTQPTSKSPGSTHNFPGKALRQSPVGAKSEARSALESLSSGLQAASITSRPTRPAFTNMAGNSAHHNGGQAVAQSQGMTAPKIAGRAVDSRQPAPQHQRSQRQYTDFSVSSLDKAEEQARNDKFKRILGADIVNLEELQKACWKGIPAAFRPQCWKLMADYLPLKPELQEKALEQKRASYWESVTHHYGASYIDANHEMLRQILNDLPRMNPLIPIFQSKRVQDIFQRVLYVWAVRHPASGYVQGINDLLTPFFAVFLTEVTATPIEEVDIEALPEAQLRQVEADAYWCMTKLLDRIQENYVFSQPGIQRNVQALEDLVKRIDHGLHAHLARHHIQFIQFAFRWMNNLLMREIPLACTIRLWDTYHAEPFGFSDFHLYVCAAFLLRFSKNITSEKDFQGLMLLLQNLPTRNLKACDVTLLTAEAYKLQVMFANSPNHTA